MKLSSEYIANECSALLNRVYGKQISKVKKYDYMEEICVVIDKEIYKDDMKLWNIILSLKFNYLWKNGAYDILFVDDIRGGE